MRYAVGIMPGKNTLAANAFIGRATAPTDADLVKALGSAKPVWDRLLADLAARFDGKNREWKCYSAKAGWSLRLLRGKRTILWMAPCEGCFRVAFALGERAVTAAHESGLPAWLLRTIDEAEKYPEGRAVRLHIKSPKDLTAVEKLAAVKIAN